MSIPPISGDSYSNYGSQPTGGTAQQLQFLIAELRNVMGDYPNNVTQIQDVAEQLKTFLENNENAIMAQCAQMGWPTSGQFGPSDMFESTINSINNFLQSPNAGSLDEINEAATQLHFEMTNQND